MAHFKHRLGNVAFIPYFFNLYAVALLLRFRTTFDVETEIYAESRQIRK